MMWKCIKKRFFWITVIFLACTNCHQNQKQIYTRFPQGYYYRLISYQPDNHLQKREKHIQLALCFKTQADSVFWDSYNNFNDLYVVSSIDIDSTRILNLVSCKAEINDSFELLLPTAPFYKVYFNQTHIPSFSQTDSIVKVQVKIKGFLAQGEYQKLLTELQERELNLIKQYFKSEDKFGKAKDSAGIYWVQRPSPWSPSPNYKYLDRLMVDYEGYFLSGRLFEKSHAAFELIYGIPDQMVKGLNYVMTSLNEGQTAKIILPSALAFGEKGSINGTVPPYTPVLYNVKLNEVKRK